MTFTRILTAAAVFCGLASAAQAGVIAGPSPLDQKVVDYPVSGLAFLAKQDSILTSFTFTNQSQADTVILTDTFGTILHSINTPALSPNQTVNVSWALTGGQDYWLFQTTLDNGMYASFNSSFPSNSDLALLFTGDFDLSVGGAVNNSRNWAANAYWADFTNITTSSRVTTVPEPVTLTMFGVGLVGAAALRRRKTKQA